MQETGVFALPVRRPVGVTMVVAAVTVFGWVSLNRLPVNLLPDISYPTLTIRTEYPGAAPEDVEERISERIQEAVAVLPGLENYVSVSRAGVSDVILEFAWNTNLALLTGEVRERLDRALLPDDAKEPLILRYDPSLDPILRIGAISDRPLRELRGLLEDDVERELETIPGVAAVKVRGGREKQISIELSENLLQLHRVDILAVASRLGQENVNLAAGRLLEGETEYVVRTLGEFESPQQIAEMVVVERGESPVRLKDLGRVIESTREPDVITRLNGRESVETEIYLEAGANLVQVASAVKDRLLGTDEQRAYLGRLDRGEIPDPQVELRKEEQRLEAEGQDPDDKKHESRGISFGGRSTLDKLRAEVEKRQRMENFLFHRLPADVHLQVLSDPSRFVQSAIDEVRSSAVTGGLLAVLVLFLFLRGLRPTGIIAISIPLSVVATFAPLHFTGISLNIMSLGGLALGVGMLVDNSIVVLESITRCREEGDTIRHAAIRGVQEVGGAVIASTLTTVAVFFPIVFISGIAGRIFRDQALAVVFSLLASLLVALFFIPTLSAIQGLGARSEESTPRDTALSAWSLYREGVARGRSLGTRFLRGLWLLPILLIRAVVRSVGQLLQWAILGIGWLLSRVIGLTLWLLARVLAGPAWLLQSALQAFRRLYEPVCRASTSRPANALLTVAIGFGLFGFAALQFRQLGTSLLPEVHQGELIAKVQLPVDSPVETTDQMAGSVSMALTRFPGVDWVSSAAGIARDQMADADEGEYSAEIVVHLGEGSRSAAVEDQLVEHIEALLASNPRVASSRIERPALFNIRSPLEVEVYGNDLQELQENTRAIAAHLKQFPTLREVKANLTRGNSEILVRFDREALRRRGLRLADVAERLRTKLQGDVATRFSEEHRRLDVVVRIDPESLDSMDRLRETAVQSTDGAEVPLRTVAELVVVEGPSEIRQIRGDRAGVISVHPTGFDIGGVARHIAADLARLPLGEDSRFAIGGQAKEASTALASLQKALLLAIFLVYIVLAAQFESFIQPLIILGSIPLATVGVILALRWLNWPVSVVVLIGAILLAGIVVNNAILLIDAMNRLRGQGLAREEAIVQACLLRLRPILMTTATTVLGLLPLTGALGNIPGIAQLPFSLGGGEGTELRAPMAVTVIAGLTTSTALTLLVIPALYSLVDRLSQAALGILRSES